ncbi:MAG: asparaginase [Candidatus Coproplasma sp.]
MKNRIFVIFTGGTIGSAVTGGSVNLDGGTKKALIDKYERLRGDYIAFDFSSPVNMLSENVQKEDLLAIFNEVKKVDPEKYDGVIITHGTDSLCFTANWLSQVLSDISYPVVLVSSLYPLGDPRSNGVDNFAGAVAFIERTRLRGVYVSFKNDDEPIKIHLASRLTYCDQLNGSYHSVLGEYFADTDGQNVNIMTSLHNPAPERIRSEISAPIPPLLCDEIMLITAHSLLNFALYDFDKTRPKAVIVELYHSGTVCTRGDNLNFLKFAQYCKSRGVKVILAPVNSSANVYASMNSLPEEVIVCRDMSFEMCLAKVMGALGANLAPDAYLEDNLFFEKLI